MKTDVNGCSTCQVGEEHYEYFKPRVMARYDTMCQYDYRHTNGELFSCVRHTLAQCRQEMSEWLVNNGYEKDAIVQYYHNEIRLERTDVFRIVDEWPLSHEVWNISRRGFPYKRYIPLVVVDAFYHVNKRNMCCIKLESEKLALAVLREAGHKNHLDKAWFEKFRDKFNNSQTTK